MDNKAKYQQFLRSPEWQEKRQEVIKRDKCCVICRQASKQLEVHHCTYKFGWLPDDIRWLATLCKSCHHRVHHRDHDHLFKLLDAKNVISG